jgi:signal transduction histidine kinase
MKILSVDDRSDNLYLLETMLRGAGYEVVSAGNGIDALQRLEEQPFDLIISDILMPRMDGFELCHQVKSNPAFQNVPFIFYTATYTDKKDEELGLSLGAMRFIIKPLEPEKFVAMIKDALEEFKSGRLPATLPLIERQDALEKAYNERLARKLDKKVGQLESLKFQLDAALADGKKARDEVRHLNAQLEERVRRRTAELEATNKDLETFTSAVSHDLRAPLRGITGWSQALAEDYADKFDEQAKSYVSLVRSEATRMGRLIEGLLELCQSTHKELHRETVNLSQLTLEIANDLQREQPERVVDFKIAPDVVVKGDPILLHALMQNLLDNAWKFTAKRSRAVISFGEVQADGKRIFFVRDNGAGFDMDRAANLFLPFERLHRVSDFPGTGIGLATVHHIVLRHGGEICAEGAVDQGATFHFTLK